MTEPLADLVELTDALYQAELAKLRTLTERESELRRDLSSLEEHRRNNLALPVSHLHAVRQIGADVLWQGWVARTRQDLNTQLAQVLAQKELMLPALRRAFGKQVASRELYEVNQNEQRLKREKFSQRNQDDLQTLKTDHP